MINQISLLTILLAPVAAYMAGAVIFSVVECARKRPVSNKCQHIISYRNGL